MKKVILCGHTGSVNRGCEAIIRSTVEILKKCGVKDISAFTFNKTDDVKLNLHKVVDLIPYPSKSVYSRALCLAEDIVFKSKVLGNMSLYKSLNKKISNDIITFNIGGDTYCYGTPSISYALNCVAKKKGFPNVFWGCSVEDNALSDTKMQKDLNKYQYIVARETLTKEILDKVVKDNTKVYLACDPAFNLPIDETVLPDNFKIGNTIGINLSPLVFKDCENPDDIMYKNAEQLINYILENTDMNVCLIPHVYNVENNLQDSLVLSNIYKKYIDSSRIGIVDKELSCTELKYIISNCRFFIGARTHATIAAYSTAVPAVALSYSIKSLGIAKDLFGQQDGYVVRWQDIKKETDLTDIFVNTLVNNESNIRERYAKILPEYKESIIKVAKEVLNKVGG